STSLAYPGFRPRRPASSTELGITRGLLPQRSGTATAPSQPVPRAGRLRPSSERPDLAAHDLHLASVEFPHDETVEALIVCATVVAQQPERLLLADEQAPNTVGAIVNAGGVTAKRNVAGELVNFVAKGERSLPPRLELQPVRAGFESLCKGVIG